MRLTSPRRHLRLLAGPVAAVVLVVSTLTVGGTASAAAAATVGLGTAAPYAVLAGTPDITSTGNTTITGDVGIHPATVVSGFPPGTISGTIHAGDADALQAKSDLVIAYDDAAGRPSDATVAGGTLGGLTLVPGVYSSGGATLALTGTLTLDAGGNPDAVWIFQASSDLVTASASSVVFTNEARACNVFWQVTSSATLGSGSQFAGTILALTSITMADAVVLDGRALARNGTVTMINDTIVAGGCAPAATPTPAASSASPGASPSAATSSTPVASSSTPVASPSGPASSAGDSLPPTDTVGQRRSSGPDATLALVLLGLLAATVFALATSRRPVPESRRIR